MERSFNVKVKDGEVYINGEFAAQLCWDEDAVGCAIAEWLKNSPESSEETEGYDITKDPKRISVLLANAIGCMICEDYKGNSDNPEDIAKYLYCSVEELKKLDVI